MQNAEDLTKDRHLAARNFFISLEHPETGTAFANRTALYSCLEKPIGWRPAPSLGEHNREVFVDLMGVSVPEFLSYMEKGIIG